MITNLFSAVLCGLNGFAVFLEENVINEIISWQSLDTGCYEYYDGSLDIQSANIKQKRSAIHLSGNCSDHMTGLAIAAFGLFAKVANQIQHLNLPN